MHIHFYKNYDKSRINDSRASYRKQHHHHTNNNNNKKEMKKGKKLTPKPLTNSQILAATTFLYEDF
jgi:hypothetical protein